ncbi:hypothetical protein ACFO3O_21895 [Dokdonia ponticola]|uniref:Lipoprotein n=1 Tax=Dokdonia ponticola TaxID=2041041 RepID=A0ABV9I3X8_9FLAO
MRKPFVLKQTMRINIIYFIIAVGLFTSCINMNDPEDQAQYISCYNSFDPVLVNLIPKKIPNNYVSFGYASLDYLDKVDDYAGMYITTKISDLKEYSSLKDNYSKQAKAIKNSLDSCLIIISTYGELDIGAQGDFNCDNPIPIPQYGICKENNSNQLWEREGNLEIIILDYQYSDLSKRTDQKKRKDIPSELSTGYSKGITLNKNNMTIQKWIVVW